MMHASQRTAKTKNISVRGMLMSQSTPLMTKCMGRPIQSKATGGIRTASTYFIATSEVHLRGFVGLTGTGAGCGGWCRRRPRAPQRQNDYSDAHDDVAEHGAAHVS